MSTNETRMARVGEPVIWHDPVGKAHNALVTAVWTATCINVVIVSSDESKTDPYGRQIERQTSCSHKSVSKVHGFYWRFPDEEPNEYVPPVEKQLDPPAIATDEEAMISWLQADKRG